ncbi:MAG: acetate--CoA ligase family protein [Burkholderiales bacterium]
MSTLEPFFAPSSVALLGASGDPTRVGGRPLHGMRLAGYDGAVYPVNPRHDSVQGLRCYPDLDAIPGSIDLAMVALPAHAVRDAVTRCAARGVRAVTIFSSGFAEVGDAGIALERDIARIAKSGGMRVLGPNCMGTMNPAKGFVGTFTSTIGDVPPEPGSVSVASQSGAFAAHVFTLLRRLAVGIDLWAATGNQADVDLADCIAHMAMTPATRVIVVCVEGVRDGPRFAAALALAQARRKAVVAIKLGASPLGAAAVASHTAVLAGSDAVFSSILRAHGAWRAESVDDLVSLAYALSFPRAPRDRTLVVASVSGGFGALLADAADRAGLSLPPLPDATQASLREMVPFAATRNPLDLTAQFINDTGVVEPMLERVLTDTAPGAMVLYLGASGEIPALVGRLLPVLERLAQRHPQQLVVLCALTGREHRRVLQAAGYLVIEDPHRAIAACAALARYAHASPPAEGSPPAAAEAPAPRWRVAPNEAEAKAWLASAGIRVPASRVVASAEEAVAAARALGYPVAMKILSSRLAHKSDIGGVELAVRDDREAIRAHERLLASVQRHDVEAFDGVLVEAMETGGVEMIVGTHRDPVFGPVVSAGFGGIFVDTLRDVVLHPLPLTFADASAMVRALSGYPILAGARGKRFDVEALARTIVQVGSLAWAARDAVDDIEINPFLLCPEGGVALDALVVLRHDVPPTNVTEERSPGAP